MKSLQLILFTLLTYFTVNAANVESVYLYYDGNCMDKYTYQHTTREAKGTFQDNHYAFHIRINDNERVILNVGKAGNNVSNYRPSNLKYCGDIVISESFSRQINKQELKVFLVSKQGNNYKVMEVKSADYFFTTDAELGYSTQEYTFAYNYSTKSKTDLATKDSRGNVYFHKRDDSYCPSKYSFRRTPPRNFEPYSDFTLVPDIGLINVKTGLDAGSANNNTLTLEMINGIPLPQYMDAVCNGYVKYLSKESASQASTAATTTTNYSRGSMADLESTGQTTRTATTSYDSNRQNNTRTTPSHHSNTSSTTTYYATSVCSHKTLLQYVIYSTLDHGDT